MRTTTATSISDFAGLVVSACFPASRDLLDPPRRFGALLRFRVRSLHVFWMIILPLILQGRFGQEEGIHQPGPKPGGETQNDSHNIEAGPEYCPARQHTDGLGTVAFGALPDSVSLPNTRRHQSSTQWCRAA